MVDLAFTTNYNGDTSTYACDFQLHFALADGDSAIYQYWVLNHRKTYPAFQMGFLRTMVWTPLDPADTNLWYFDWAHVDSLRNFPYPTNYDIDHGLATGIAEIEQLTTGTYKGLYHSKYEFCGDLWSLDAFGQSSSKHGHGLFVVQGSHEWYGFGPIQQDLGAGGVGAIHILPQPGHYDAPSFAIPKGQEWHKIYGPWLLYFNRGSTPAAMWADSKARAATESSRWPYTWMTDSGYHATGRGKVAGRFVVKDATKTTVTGAGFWVGLAKSDTTVDPLATDPQFESRGYQYWVKADAGGNFVISDVQPGTYSLFAWGPGEVGQYRQDSIVVAASATNGLGIIRWGIDRSHGPIAWEIGIPDRKSAEFSGGTTFFKGYNWNQYHRQFSNPLVYTVGQSDWHKDWNYVHDAWSDPIPDAYTTTSVWPWQSDSARVWPWEIHFTTTDVAASDTALLTIAIAGSTYSRLDMSLDGKSLASIYPPNAGGNALIRQSDHAKYGVITVPIPTSKLAAGAHVLTLTEGRVGGTIDLFYDYLSLEIPQTPLAVRAKGAVGGTFAHARIESDRLVLDATGFATGDHCDLRVMGLDGRTEARWSGLSMSEGRVTSPGPLSPAPGLRLVEVRSENAGGATRILPLMVR